MLLYPRNLKFRGYYGFGLDAAKACVSRNCDTNAFIKLIFDTTIDGLEWKNSIAFCEYRKTKMAPAAIF